MGEVWQLVVEVVLPLLPLLPFVGPNIRYRLRSIRRESYGFSNSSNHGRYRIGRKGNSLGKSRTRPREWDSKVGKFRRTSRKYYRSCMGKGTRKVGGIKRIVGRTSTLTGRDRSKGLGRFRNRRSGWSRSRRVVANRSVDSRIVTGRVVSGNKQGRNPYRRVCDRVHR